MSFHCYKLTSRVTAHSESHWSREIHAAPPRGKETKGEPHWSTPCIVGDSTGSCFGATRNFIPASGQTAVCLENGHKNPEHQRGSLLKSTWWGWAATNEVWAWNCESARPGWILPESVPLMPASYKTPVLLAAPQIPRQKNQSGLAVEFAEKKVLKNHTWEQ